MIEGTQNPGMRVDGGKGLYTINLTDPEYGPAVAFMTNARSPVGFRLHAGYGVSGAAPVGPFQPQRYGRSPVTLTRCIRRRYFCRS